MLTGSPAAPVPELSFSTRDVAPADRVAAWQRALSRVLVDLEVTVERGRPWAAELATERWGPLQIATVGSGPGTVVRTARSVAADRRTHILVRQQLDGGALLLQDGRTAELLPGSLSFLDARRPFRVVLPRPQRARILMVPRAQLRLDEGQLSALTATVAHEQGEGAAALLLPLLHGLVEEVTRAPAGRRERLAGVAAEILATVALEQVGSRSETGLWERITACVQERLGEPGLSPRDLADQHGVSLRYLHRLFQQQGTTVSSWIRARRLEAAREELARPGAAHRSIAAVAARWGFASPSHFSRSFRETYGVSPLRWREASRTARTAPGAAEPPAGP
ncbi:helix-turn-helix domain-containing protein [Streptomyces sp. E-15]